MAESVREPARAKLNLRLRVLGRGDDGYHALETIFLRLALADEVELRRGTEGIELEVEAAPPDTSAGDGPDGHEQGSLFSAEDGEGGGGPGLRPGGTEAAGSTAAPRAPDADRDDEEDPDAGDSRHDVGGPGAGGPGGGEAAAGPSGRVDLGSVPRGPDNLCWRAAAAFYEAVGREPDVSIRLRKRIPAAGGLGGGSADAAAVLRGLARLHDDAPAPAELVRLAGELGSDVPFALLDRPMSLGWGRGCRLMPLTPPSPRPMLLVVPEARVSTPEAYRWLDEDRGEGRGGGPGDEPGGEGGPGAASAPASRAGADFLPGAGELADWEALFSVRGNDFETSVFARLPELGWWKEELLGEGAEAALLCGSGSTLCGIFADARRRDAAVDRLREGAEVRVVKTRGPV